MKSRLKSRKSAQALWHIIFINGDNTLLEIYHEELSKPELVNFNKQRAFELLKAEESSKKELLNVFKELGYEIKL